MAQGTVDPGGDIPQQSGLFHVSQQQGVAISVNRCPPRLGGRQGAQQATHRLLGNDVVTLAIENRCQRVCVSKRFA